MPGEHRSATCVDEENTNGGATMNKQEQNMKVNQDIRDDVEADTNASLSDEDLDKVAAGFGREKLKGS